MEPEYLSACGHGTEQLNWRVKMINKYPIQQDSVLRLKKDYWLYIVFNCASTPELHLIQDPARLGWKPIVQIDHYHVGADVILQENGQ